MTPRFPGIKRIVHFAFGRRGLEREIDEEIAFHFEEAIVELRSRGMSEQEARDEADRRFGSVPEYKVALTRIGEARRADVERKELLDTVQQHLSFAWRGVRHRPWFALTVALTLALGIGANSVMFSVIDRLLFRAPEQIVEPDQVRHLYIHRPVPGFPQFYPAVSLAEVDAMRLGSPHIAAIAAFTHVEVTYGEGIAARKLEAVAVQADYFKVLKTAPFLGRFFAPSDDSTALDGSAAVLSYGFWQREFGGDLHILGRTLRLGDHRYTIVGVAPEGFTGSLLEPVEFWLPLRPAMDAMYGGAYWRSDASQFVLSVILRVNPRSSVAAAETDLLSRYRGASLVQAERYHWQQVVLASLIPARNPNRAAEIPVALWLGGTALVVLLIACANVATLLLARAIQRRRENAVRLALGIGRARLIVHLVSESLLLSLTGGLLALGLSYGGGGLLRSFLLPGFAWPTSAIDIRVVLFTIVIACSAGVLAGLVPAWLESRPDLLSALKSGGSGGGLRKSTVQSALIIAQAAMSVALLVGAGLFVRSLGRVRALDLGLEPDKVLIAFTALPRGVNAAERDARMQSVLVALGADPAVEHAALTAAAPLEAIKPRRFPVIEGFDSTRVPANSSLFFNAVSPDYFAAIGTRLDLGRTFNLSDGGPGAPVTIVSAALARLVWRDANPIGRCFGGATGGQPCLRVVGVVADARWSEVFESDAFAYYTPMGQDTSEHPYFLVIRPRGDAVKSIEHLRRELFELLPDARSIELQSFQDRVDPAIRSWRLGATLFLAFGALALVVAAIGLYSVMACRVEQRRHEMGVRSALGAEWGDLIRLVVGEGVLLVAGGVLLGLAVALAAAPAIGPLLYQTSPRDPTVLGVVTVVLLASAAVACAVPALRAGRVAPMEALKAE